MFKLFDEVVVSDEGSSELNRIFAFESNGRFYCFDGRTEAPDSKEADYLGINRWDNCRKRNQTLPIVEGEPILVQEAGGEYHMRVFKSFSTDRFGGVTVNVAPFPGRETRYKVYKLWEEHIYNFMKSGPAWRKTCPVTQSLMDEYIKEEAMKKAEEEDKASHIRSIDYVANLLKECIKGKYGPLGDAQVL